MDSHPQRILHRHYVVLQRLTCLGNSSCSPHVDLRRKLWLLSWSLGRQANWHCRHVGSLQETQDRALDVCCD